ncbi:MULTISPECIES: Crp/Fnr family transcriptional regulator [unclassified Streptomyces]|uniref:Crp/Fnr family transcriptional regulator n=1 Tax=unclassified Streptomyces TaxID=2593676 RepID=UPI00081BA1C6|nr:MULTISPECIES: Crp/Fnr family transcriptional regulator [unclassified Streptomyces]MYQ52530.1 cyclic nucleotide-binding domain-containing protein [Streptomyces sp. SID4941]SCD84533.1 cAMP-binding domain of CRP or a regulatory subunit of cAMP-dependent protein kinases [Streptomyces sp. PalvLS-984]SDC84622.1 cAMP-binding domain of CRP or a regulatory subunit of cAMP-dependent protein kinases [Streptomyces sp. AmelKG-A3]
MAILCFWDMLDDTEKAALGGFGRTRAYRAGQRLVAETDVDCWTGVIAEGTCRVTGGREDGSRSYLAARGPGDIIGEMAAVRGARRTAEVTAVTQVVVHVLPASKFQRLLETHPSFTRHLLTVALDRLQEADRRRSELAVAATEVRLNRMLVRLARTEGVPVPDSRGVVLHGVAQTDLAEWCGVSRASVQRQLRRLAAEGLLRAGPRRRELTVLDPDELMASTARAKA